MKLSNISLFFLLQHFFCLSKVHYRSDFPITQFTVCHVCPVCLVRGNKIQLIKMYFEKTSINVDKLCSFCMLYRWRSFVCFLFSAMKVFVLFIGFLKRIIWSLTEAREFIRVQLSISIENVRKKSWFIYGKVLLNIFEEWIKKALTAFWLLVAHSAFHR